MRSKPHQNQQPSGAEPPPENAAQPKNPMENFRALVMTMAINCTPNKSLSPAQKIFVRQKLQESFPDSKSSPDHPTYSWMILKAIENLNEEGGSTKEAISKYIVKEYSDLPWAHATLLTHHLGKLCESDDIFMTVEGYYALNPNTNICTISSPNECISSIHSSEKKREDQKNMQKKVSKKERGDVKCDDGRGEKVETDVEKEATEEQDLVVDASEEQHPHDQQGQEEASNLKVEIQPQGLDDNAHVEPKEQAKHDFVSRECYEDEEKKLDSKQVHEMGKRRRGKAPKRKRRKLVIFEDEEEEIDVQVLGLDSSAQKEPNKQMQQDLTSEECNEEQQPSSKQGQQKGRRMGILPKRRIKEEEEENNLEIDGQPLRFEDGAKTEPNKQMRQDFVSEKCRGEQLNREQGPEKGNRRSSRVPKRSRRINDLEEQTNAEIHVVTRGLEDTAPEEPNEECNKDEEQQPNIKQRLDKGKRKHGKPHKNVVEEMTNSESDFQPQELDDAQNENKQMQQRQEKGKRKLGRRQQHLLLQTCRPKTKSSEGLSMKPSASPLQSSNQKNTKHEGSAKPQEIRRSTRISIATSKKRESQNAT